MLAMGWQFPLREQDPMASQHAKPMEDIPFQAGSKALGPARHCACLQTAAAEQLSFSLAYHFLAVLIHMSVLLLLFYFTFYIF